jgi:catechol 2,3-dioxygenase-like lactoylglutathione lyase family enzyme
MNIQSCTPLLNVEDIDASLEFWRGLLGFEVANSYSYEGRLAWAMLTCGAARLMLNRHGGDPAARRQRAPYTEGMVFFDVDSVHDLVRDLRAKGFDAPEPSRESYGLDELIIRDPDGYEIGFTSRVAADADRSVARD